MRKHLTVLFALLLAACGQTVSLTVDDAKYRPPLVDGGTGVAYFSITSNVADRIVAISSPRAEAVEIHESSTGDGGMASMQKVESVELPAGKRVTFGPGGLHLMVIAPRETPSPATFPIHIMLESGRVETVGFPY